MKNRNNETLHRERVAGWRRRYLGKLINDILFIYLSSSSTKNAKAYCDFFKSTFYKYFLPRNCKVIHRRNTHFFISFIRPLSFIIPCAMSIAPWVYYPHLVLSAVAIQRTGEKVNVFRSSKVSKFELNVKEPK